MAAKQKVITDKALQQKPGQNDIWLNDPAPRGYGRFCARITKAGKRLFYFKYTSASGKREYIPIGSYSPQPKSPSELTLADARDKAGELSRLYQDGTTELKAYLEDQQRLDDAQRAAELAKLEAERLEAESRLTVQALFDKWQAQKLTKRKNGGKEITRLFEKDVLPAIGHLPAESIRKGNITAITDSIENRGANRMAKIAFASMRQMFQFALERDFIEIDPTAGLKKANIGGKDVERDRVLSEEEIRLLAEREEEAGLLPTAQAAIWICLSTCCRIGELMKARWEHVDFEKMIWTIPADNAKNEKAHEVHLSDFAFKQFKIVREFNHDTPWLYPNRTKNDHVCTKTITKQVGDRQRTASMSKRSKNTGTLCLPGGKWVMHDLRRTGATLMSMLGIAPVVIERCLNHTEQNKVQRIYQRYSYAPEMKQAWDLLGKRLVSLTAGKKPAQIIQLDKSLSA